MRLLHDLAKIHATFDDPDLVSRAGLVPVMALACRAGLAVLVEEHVQISRPCGVNAQVKVPGIVLVLEEETVEVRDRDVHPGLNGCAIYATFFRGCPTGKLS